MLQHSINRSCQKAGLTLHQSDLSFGEISYFDNENFSADDTILLLHDHGMDKTCWLTFARFFNGHRVIIPDLPGHGLSTQGMDIDYGIAHQAGRLLEFVQAGKFGARLHLIGHGSGATIALHLAARQSALLSSLTVMAALGVERTPSDLKTRVFGIGNNPLLEIRNVEDYRKMRQISMSHPPFLPSIFMHLLAQRRLARQTLDTKILRDMERDLNQIDHLRQIHRPSFVIWGQEDRITHVNDANLLCEMITDSTKVLLVDVGHVPILEKPQLTANHCLQFLQSLPN